MHRATNVLTRSKPLFYGGLVSALLLLITSQIIQSIVIPDSGAVPPPSLIAFGATLTFFAFLSTLVMTYSMLLRRRGQ